MCVVEPIPGMIIAQQVSVNSLIISRGAVEEIQHQTESNAQLVVPKPKCDSAPFKELKKNLGSWALPPKASILDRW